MDKNMSDNYWNHDNLPKVGQMVLTSNGQEAEYRTMYEDQVCLHSETHGLVIHTLSSIKPIQDPKKTLRDNEIQKMTGIAHGSGNGSASEKLYDAGYRKVKPLPADWGTDCLNSDLTLNDYLIEKGYYIAEDN
jgi:hypothetical protein